MWELLNQFHSHSVDCEMNRWMTVSLSKPRMVGIIGLRCAVPNFVGCVSPLDARYASPARKSALTGQISRKPVAARLGGTRMQPPLGDSMMRMAR